MLKQIAIGVGAGIVAFELTGTTHIVENNWREHVEPHSPSMVNTAANWSGEQIDGHVIDNIRPVVVDVYNSGVDGLAKIASDRIKDFKADPHIPDDEQPTRNA